MDTKDLEAEIDEIVNDKEMNDQTDEKAPPHTFKTGAVYKGAWKNGVRNGFGSMTWANGA